MLISGGYMADVNQILSMTKRELQAIQKEIKQSGPTQNQKLKDIVEKLKENMEEIKSSPEWKANAKQIREANKNLVDALDQLLQGQAATAKLPDQLSTTLKDFRDLLAPRGKKVGGVEHDRL